MIGGKSGIVNEATNQEANQRLTDAIQQMSSKEYMKSRDLTDVIPTHAHLVEQPKKRSPNEGLAVFTLERKGDDEEQGEDDDELEFLRERRMQAMRRMEQQRLEYAGKQHGTYREIAQDDFFNIVVREKGGSDRVAVHFYHKDFERCKIIDRHMTDLAVEMFNVKFVKIDVQKSPFLIDKLRVNVLPAILLFRDDVCADRVVGFDDMGNKDDFDTEVLKRRLQIGLGLIQADE
mgnify:FL=1